MPDIEDKNIKIEEVDPAVKEMVEAGVFYGRKKSHSHPRMKSYILQNRNGVEVINLQRTRDVLDEAIKFLKEKISAGGGAVIVGTQPSFEDLVLGFAKESNLSYVLRRWPGGTFTNFKVISRRIEHFKKMKADMASGAFDKYTKKERLELEREINRLAELFQGLETMTKLPEALIVIDPVIHMTAVREAKQLHIPVIAFANVDADPQSVEYPVVGNTKGRTSVKWFLDQISAAVQDARRNMGAPAATVAKPVVSE